MKNFTLPLLAVAMTLALTSCNGQISKKEKEEAKAKVDSTATPSSTSSVESETKAQ